MWAFPPPFIPGPFQGGHFLGEIIYSSALDLEPVTFDLRPGRDLKRFYCTWVRYGHLPGRNCSTSA